MANVDGQVIKSYLPGDPKGTGAFQDELQNQQLNDALNSGTVDGILMKTGYGAIYDHHVIIKKDLAAYAKLTDVTNQIEGKKVYDFEHYDSTKNLYVKSNANPTVQVVPTLAHITRIGEIAVDNFDGSLYLLGSQGTVVQKVDAGTVNGFVVEADVKAGLGDDATMTRGEIRDLINSVFDFTLETNTLIIKAV